MAALYGVFSSVPVRSLLSSLPPNCPRTRLKDAKTRPPGSGLHKPFLAFLGGEGGFEPPVPQRGTMVFETAALNQPCHHSAMRAPPSKLDIPHPSSVDGPFCPLNTIVMHLGRGKFRGQGVGISTSTLGRVPCLIARACAPGLDTLLSSGRKNYDFATAQAAFEHEADCDQAAQSGSGC